MQFIKKRGCEEIKPMINFSVDIFVKTLTSSYTLFITQTHLADRCPICYVLSNFIPAKRSKWRGVEDKVLYLLSVMTSGLRELVRDGEFEQHCSVSTDSNPACRCQCPFKALITPFPRA